MKKNGHIRKKIGSIFVIISILFILGCCIYYGNRLIHYYRIEHPHIKENETLFNLVTLKKNIVERGKGLYKEDEKYIFKGKVTNNYVKYSGRIWRIVNVDGNDIKLITDTPQTSLVWGIKTTYDNSYVKSWLNSDTNKIKSFYETLTNLDILTTTKTCTDVISEDSIVCNTTIEENVGLLSIYEYQQAGGKDSYLNIGEYWWTSNVTENNSVWYVYTKGNINSTISSGKTYFSYGVRPTITIKGNTRIVSGDGTKDNPYNFDISVSNYLNTKYIGEYIKYSGYDWRIIDIDEEYIKIVMDGVIKKDNEDFYTSYGNSNYMTSSVGLGKYLNNDFYNTLENKEEILNHSFYMGRYDKTYNYDFNMITEHNETMNVGLLQLGELFITDVDNYFLSTRTITSDGMIYEVIKDGKIYVGSVDDQQRVRPTLYFKVDTVVIGGSGTKNDPYMIG